jgi:hypothetical protein
VKGKIRPSAAGDNRSNPLRFSCSRLKSSGCARAGSEVSERYSSCFRLLLNPPSIDGKTVSQQIYVEDLPPVQSLNFLQEINQQCGYLCLLQDLGNKVVSGTQTAASASMGKDNHTPRI